MKPIAILLCFFLCLNVTNAQLGKLKNAVKDKKEAIKQKVNDKIDGKIEEKVEEKLDKVFNPRNSQQETKDGETRPNNNPVGDFSKVFSGEKITGEYSFDLSVTYITTTSDDQDEVEMEQFFSKEGKYLGMAAEGGLLIMDFENTASYAISENRVMKVPYSTAVMESSLEKEYFDYLTINKTSKTKTILGKTCVQYLFENSDNGDKGDVWMYQSSDYNVYGVLGKETVTLPDGTVLKGVVMESNTEDDKGVKTTMKAVSFTENKKTYKLDEYESMDMSSFIREQNEDH